MSGRKSAVVGVVTHSMVKVHVVGDDVDVWMEDVILSDHLLQDVADSRREDQQRHPLLSQTVEKHPVAFPGDMNASF